MKHTVHGWEVIFIENENTADGLSVEVTTEDGIPDGVFINQGVLDSGWPEDKAAVWLSPERLSKVIIALQTAQERIKGANK